MKKKQKNAACHIESPKVEAKLRMVANADQDVNEIRAEFSGNIVVKKNYTFSVKQSRYFNPEKISNYIPSDAKKKDLSKPPTNIETNVFIELSPSSSGKINGEITRSNNLVSAKLPLTALKEMADRDDVIGIEHSRMIKFIDPLVNEPYIKKAPSPKYLRIRKEYAPKHKVLVGIIDVGGFDFAHPDFLTANNKTRFLHIWDQGADSRPSPARSKNGKPVVPENKKFDYGAEFLAEDLNKAILNAKKIGVPATSLEKQSQNTPGSHGTHVSSIAAGNSGVFPYADIVAVTIALKESDQSDRRKSFYDSACLIHAVEYLLNIADHYRKPISINISLGTNGHAHDGSDVTSRWLDAKLATPGRSVCIAAGNAGQEKPLTNNDLGFLTGRIHTSSKIEATGLSKDILWNVVGNGVSDISENELEIWYPPQDRLGLMLKPPGMDWIGPVLPNEYIENKQLKDGTFVSIYSDLYHFANGCNYIAVYLSPNFNRHNIIPVRAGEWQVRLIGHEIRDGHFDGWIERDDPRQLGTNGTKALWNFPSFFSESSNIDNSSISSLACSKYVIAVGNYDQVKEVINISSSQGPTRDKRNKPEVIAPGTNIIAAKGFSSADDRWISMTGTSMASPFACGIAAWMLSLEKNLTAAQIQGIIIRTSTPLPGQDYNWKNDTGFGFINPQACLAEALSIRTKKDKTKTNDN